MGTHKIEFNQIWIENRFRYRKGMRGSTMRKDEITGYLEPKHIQGFTAEKKATFIKRYEVCDNKTAIVKSLYINIQSLFDAIALDENFRNDVIRCDKIEGRAHSLNNALLELVSAEKNKVISDLSTTMKKYGG